MSNISASFEKFELFAADHRRQQIYYSVAAGPSLYVHVDGSEIDRWVLYQTVDEATFLAAHPEAIRVDQIDP